MRLHHRRLQVFELVPSKINVPVSFCCNVKVVPAPKFAGVITALPAPLFTTYLTCPATPSAILYVPAVPFVISVNGSNKDNGSLEPVFTVSCLRTCELFSIILPVPFGLILNRH